jgi:hypothetical protein
MYAEIFCAALESAAFVEKSIYKLIDIGLSYIPEDCGVTKVVKLVLDSFKSGKPYLEVRDEIFSKYRAHYWGYAGISKEDKDKGFDDGPLGWDVPANIGFNIIGLLYGYGDFGKSMCITVNCGEDTDCTGATLGSIFGIIHGIEAIPKRWIDPIGRSIKTMCLNLGELQGQIPGDIDALTQRVENIAKQVVLRYCPSVEFSEIKATDLSDLNDKYLFSELNGKSIYRNLNGPIFKFDSFDVMVDYLEGPYVKNNLPKKISFKIQNKYKISESLNIKWYTDEGWSISPANHGKVFVGSWTESQKEIVFDLSKEKVDNAVTRFVLELTIDGKHTVMLVPVILLNGNLITI